MLGGRGADLLGRRTSSSPGRPVRASLAGLRRGRLARPAAGRTRAAGLRRRGGLAGHLSIITSSFEEGAERNRAVGLGRDGRARRLLGGAAGRPADPGVRLAAIFAINVPLGIAVIVSRPAHDPAPGRARETQRTSTSGRRARYRRAGALRYGIVRTDTLGWGSAGRARAARSRAWPCSAPSCSSRRASRSRRWCRCRSSAAAAAGRQPRRDAALRVVLPGLVLPHPLPAAGPALRRDRGRDRASCR